MLQQFTNSMLASNGRKNKVSGMIEINQNQGFISPNSYQSADQDIGLFLKQKFAKLHHHQKEQWIKNAVHNLYGRHNAINYKQEYNFRQKWEQSTKPTYFQSKQSLIKTQNLMPTYTQIVLLMFYAATIWFLTIYRLFNANSLINIFVPLVIITQIKDVLLKMYFIKKAIQEDHDIKARLVCFDYIKLHWSNLVFIPYAILIMFQNFQNQAQKQSLFIIFDFFFIWRAYLRLAEIYDGIKIRIMASKYRNELQVVQLLARCIYVVHFIGIILYFVSKQNVHNNWASDIGDFNNDWMTRYIYSLYFASTTLTTVGYGDITPQNVIEILSILFIQIFGIINFGFIINEIGRILAKINEKQQILTKNISQAENIAETYKIPEALALQMRNYIINNQIAHDQLNIEEEDNFMRKLNDQIRQGFNTLNQIRIIKSSIFFLCHWSKKFQRSIACKLIRNVYSPQQSLIQIQGKEKLYILTRGKIDVFACLIDRSLMIAIRPLKVIEMDPNKQVHNNTYGYSSLVSNLEIKLKAVVKDYSICYSLTRQDFLNSIVQDRKDFEYFHQIKSKIEQSYHKQIWEAPNINNTREHYLPNPTYVVMKNRHQAQAQRLKRKSRHRRYKKTKCYIQAEIQASSQQILSEQSQKSSNEDDSLLQKMINQPVKVPQNQILTEKERIIKYQNILNANKPYLINSRGYSHKKKNKKQSFEDEIQKRKYQSAIVKQNILNDFQEYAIFHSFFPKANLDKMLQRYQKIYHKKMFFDLNSQKSQKSQKSQRLQTMNQISEDIMRKLLNIRVFGSQYLD